MEPHHFPPMFAANHGFPRFVLRMAANFSNFLPASHIISPLRRGSSGTTRFRPPSAPALAPSPTATATSTRCCTARGSPAAGRRRAAAGWWAASPSARGTGLFQEYCITASLLEDYCGGCSPAWKRSSVPTCATVPRTVVLCDSPADSPAATNCPPPPKMSSVANCSLPPVRTCPHRDLAPTQASF